MKKKLTKFKGLFVFSGEKYYDKRGYLREVFLEKKLKKKIKFSIVSSVVNDFEETIKYVFAGLSCLVSWSNSLGSDPVINLYETSSEQSTPELIGSFKLSNKSFGPSNEPPIPSETILID